MNDTPDPVQATVTRAEVRAALDALDAMARQALHPKGLAGLPVMFAMLAGLDDVPPLFATLQTASAAVLASSEPVTISVTLGGRVIAELSAT